MIKANELRVGNWVIYHGETDMPCKIDGQDIYNISIEHMHNHEIHSPIPLTPEVLEKCGFTPNAVDQLAIEINDTSTHLEATFYENFCYMAIDQQQAEGEPQNVGLKRIESLHQLQNLYFALTGTELTYIP